MANDPSFRNPPTDARPYPVPFQGHKMPESPCRYDCVVPTPPAPSPVPPRTPVSMPGDRPRSPRQTPHTASVPTHPSPHRRSPGTPRRRPWRPPGILGSARMPPDAPPSPSRQSANAPMPASADSPHSPADSPSVASASASRTPESIACRPERGNQVDAIGHRVMLARPMPMDERYFLGIWLIERRIVRDLHAARPIPERSDFLPAGGGIGFEAMQEAGEGVVGGGIGAAWRRGNRCSRSRCSAAYSC